MQPGGERAAASGRPRRPPSLQASRHFTRPARRAHLPALILVLRPRLALAARAAEVDRHAACAAPQLAPRLDGLAARQAALGACGAVPSRRRLLLCLLLLAASFRHQLRQQARPRAPRCRRRGAVGRHLTLGGHELQDGVPQADTGALVLAQGGQPSLRVRLVGVVHIGNCQVGAAQRLHLRHEERRREGLGGRAGQRPRWRRCPAPKRVPPHARAGPCTTSFLCPSGPAHLSAREHGVGRQRSQRGGAAWPLGVAARRQEPDGLQVVPPAGRGCMVGAAHERALSWRLLACMPRSPGRPLCSHATHSTSQKKPFRCSTTPESTCSVGAGRPRAAPAATGVGPPAWPAAA